jgi:hypothetical protein
MLGNCLVEAKQYYPYPQVLTFLGKKTPLHKGSTTFVNIYNI